MDNNEELGPLSSRQNPDSSRQVIYTYSEEENISMTIHIQPKKSGPITPDECKQLAGFFEALMDLEPKEDKNKKTKE